MLSLGSVIFFIYYQAWIQMHDRKPSKYIYILKKKKQPLNNLFINYL